MNGGKLALGVVAGMVGVSALRGRGSRSQLQSWIHTRISPTNKQFRALDKDIRQYLSSTFRGWGNMDESFNFQIRADLDIPSVEDIGLDDEDEGYLDDFEIERDVQRFIEDWDDDLLQWVHYEDRSLLEPITSVGGGTIKAGGIYRITLDFDLSDRNHAEAGQVFRSLWDAADEEPAQSSIRGPRYSLKKVEERIQIWNKGIRLRDLLASAQHDFEDSLQSRSEEMYEPSYWEGDIDCSREIEAENEGSG